MPMDKEPNPSFEGAIRNPDDLVPGEIYCRHHSHLNKEYLVRVLEKKPVKLNWKDQLTTEIKFIFLGFNSSVHTGFGTDWGLEPYEDGWNPSNYTVHVPVPEGRGRKARMRSRS